MRKLGSLLAVILIAAGSTNAGATALTFRGTMLDGKKADLIKEIKLLGDLRLRHESFSRRTAQAGRVSGRDRERFRLRYGADFILPSDLSVGFYLASGTGEQVSPNQSFDNLSGQKAVWIDKAFVLYAPKLLAEGKTSVSAGRMPNPFWQVASSDVLWDPDVNPEGFAEGVEWRGSPLGGTWFVNALQMVADEDGSSRANQWMIGAQLGAEYGLPSGCGLRAAGAFYEWTNARITDFGQALAQDGNRRQAGGSRLLNDFKVAELTTQLSGKAAAVPVRLQGTFLRNTAAITEEAAGRGEQSRNQFGYQVGSIFGEASAARTWELAYFYKWLESDAAVADTADSDFGTGGTNRRGHILWAAYSPADWLQFKAKYFYTRLIADGLPPGTNLAANPGDDVNRFQLDFLVKF